MTATVWITLAVACLLAAAAGAQDPPKTFVEARGNVRPVPLPPGGPPPSAWRRYSLSANNEDLTENFCTNNENVEQFLKLAEQERARQQGR